MTEVNYSYDATPPRKFCPPDWAYSEFATREGVTIAADYWEERGESAIANWLRLWADLSPDDMERTPGRRGGRAVIPWSDKNTKWAKRLKSRQERIAAKQNPLAPDAYGFNGIW